MAMRSRWRSELPATASSTARVSVNGCSAGAGKGGGGGGGAASAGAPTRRPRARRRVIRIGCLVQYRGKVGDIESQSRGERVGGVGIRAQDPTHERRSKIEAAFANADRLSVGAIGAA